MYTLSGGPSKIASKTRRAPTSPAQTNFDQLSRKGKEEIINMTSPKPVFNGKPRYNNRNHQVSRHHELVAAPHEEMVRYISDAWNKVSKEYEAHRKAGRDLTIVYYQEKVPNPQLNGFEPFDLESWWGNRILKDITQSS